MSVLLTTPSPVHCHVAGASSVRNSDTGNVGHAEANGDLVIETERLRIRRLTWDDLPALIELFGNLEVMRFSTTGPLPAAHVAQVLERILKSYQDFPLSLWGVMEKSNPQLIGLCGFLWYKPSREGESELAYRFLPRSWGRGLATEAVRACSDLARRSPTVQCVTALIEKENVGSIRVAMKAGLEFDAETHLNTLPVLKFSLRLVP